MIKLIEELRNEVSQGENWQQSIAKYIGSPQSSRMVGWAMNSSHNIHDVPAHRVDNICCFCNRSRYEFKEFLSSD